MINNRQQQKRINTNKLLDEKIKEAEVIVDELERSTDILDEIKTTVESLAGLSFQIVTPPGKEGPVGPMGPEPSDERLVQLIEPLIPEPIKGDKGDKGDKPIAGVDYPIPLNGRDGKDGETIVGPQGPAGKDGKDGNNGSPDTGKEIVDKINGLKISPEFQIDAKHIKNLPKAKTARRGGGGGTVNYEDLTSQCNGVTKTFTVPSHSRVVALLGTQFPIIYRPVVDFTTSGTTLTLTSEVSAPATGQTLTFLYG